MMAKLSLTVVFLVIAGMLMPTEAEAAFTGLPNDLRDRDFATGVPLPTAFAWLPDGDILIASKSGGLYRANPNGHNVTNLGLPIAVCDQGERGLLGVAVDPDFGAEPGDVFVYYTANQGDVCFNRVSKFQLGPGNAVGAEVVLIDRIPSPATNHNGGDIQFDRNELLYVSVGDGANGTNARRFDVLNGKILRIDRDGDIPAGNPLTGSGSQVCGATGSAAGDSQRVEAEQKSKKKRRARKRKRRQQRRESRGPDNACQEIFATGLRNPFRIAFDPDDASGAHRFFINDVGQQTWEEIDEGLAGANYGWDVREGPCPQGETHNCKRDKRFVQPIHAYRHSTGCRSITGGAFVPNSSLNWPVEYDDSYIFADFVCDKLFRLRPTSGGVNVQEFAANETATHLAFGPDGALYYSAFFDNEVRRIEFDPEP